MKRNIYIETKNKLFKDIKRIYNIDISSYNDYLYSGIKNNKKIYFLFILKEEVTFKYLNQIVDILKSEGELLYPLIFVTNKNVDESAKTFISLFNGDLDILKV